MDAAELMEWVAFSNLKDDEYKRKLQIELQKDFTAEEEAKALKAFFNGIPRGRKLSGKKR